MGKQIIDWLRSNWRKSLVSLGSVFLPLLAFWLSPLKGAVFDRIWPEDASLQVSLIPDHLSEGDAFTVRIMTIPHSGRSISAGLLTLRYDHSQIHSRDKTDFVEIQPSAGPTLREFHFVAVTHGVGVITSELRTQKKDYNAPIDLLIRERTSADRPSFENITGVWSFHVSLRQGELHLSQSDDRRLSGSYEMEPQETGSITGYRDGCVVFVQLTPSKGKSKTILDGNLGQNAEVLEIRGDASRASLEDPDLKRQTAGAFEGSARASTPAEIPDCLLAKK
jgi:hypothetical protein